MQQQNAFNATESAGDAGAARLKRHPLSVAILGVTLALQAGGALAEEQNGNGSLELVATSITDNRLGETTEGTGSNTTGSTRTATKLSLSPRETPQSVSVITRQQTHRQEVLQQPGFLRRWLLRRSAQLHADHSLRFLMREGPFPGQGEGP